MTTGVHWGSLLLLEWFKGHDYYWCITIAYFNASHHAWVSFEATAEVYNEVCKGSTSHLQQVHNLQLSTMAS